MRKLSFVWVLFIITLVIGCDEETKLDPIKIQVESINITIDENPTVGQVLSEVQVISNRDDLVFSLSDQNPSGAMEIDSKTGRLTVLDETLFNYEKNPELTAKGVVSVGGVTESAEITIRLNDIDETFLNASDLTVTIDENPEVSTVLGQIQASSNAGSISFEITSQTPEGAMSIDNLGNVVVNDASLFDYEANSTIQASILVTSGNKTQTVTATINLNDVVEVTNPFITVWYTSSSNETVTIPININSPLYTYNYTVSWGDGTSDSYGKTNASHTYANAGQYSVEITGDFAGIYFNQEGDRNKILAIDAWGDIEWQTMESAFSGCYNMIYRATDSPDLSKVSDMSQMFYYASRFVGNSSIGNWNVSSVNNMKETFFGSDFNQNISNWDVSKVTNMAGLFGGTPFNQNIGNWDVSNVTIMSSMFWSTEFNQDIGSWNVGNVTSMESMFQYVSSFNQDIGSWDMNGVTNTANMFYLTTSFNQDISNWNMSNVVDMGGMFRQAISFNQDISSWDVGKVKSFLGTFMRAEAFNQNLGSWNISSVTDMRSFLRECNISTANYDATLKGWANLATVPSNITLFATDAKYCSEGEIARNFLINTKGWTITGDSRSSAIECN